MQLRKQILVGCFMGAIGGSVAFAAATYLASYGVPTSIPLVSIAGIATGFFAGAAVMQGWRGDGWRGWARGFFGIDLRSLALFRIGMALSILIDLAMRARDLTAHYSDDGILSLASPVSRPSDLSLHMLSGDAFVQGLLFSLAALFGVLLLVGYQTRLATVVSWFLMISLHNRNPLVLNGGDVYFLLMMFWAMFLPLGARYSVDNARNVSFSKRRTIIADAASLAMLVQIVCLYFFAGLHKTHPQWHVDGSAAYYALSLDMLTTSIGQHLLNYPRMLRGATFLVLYTQLFVPILVFMPWRTAVFRTISFILAFTFHVGILFCVWIGVFPLVCIAAVTVLLPSGVWDWIGRRTRQADQKLVIYHDASSPFCRSAVLLLRTFLVLRGTRIRRLVAFPCAAASPKEPLSPVIVSTKDAQQHQGFNALLTLLRHSPLMSPCAWFFACRPCQAVGQWLCGVIARRRVLFDRMACWFRIRRIRIRTFWPVQPLVAVCLVYVVLYNIDSLPDTELSWFKRRSTVEVFGKRIAVSPRVIYNTGRQLRLGQRWNMFSPHPLMNDGWFVVRGTMKNDRRIDVRTGKPVTFAKPESVAWTYPNNRWRKYMELLPTKGRNSRRQLEYCRYMGRQWNITHDDDEQLVSIDLYFVKERSRPPGERLTHQPTLVNSCRLR